MPTRRCNAAPFPFEIEWRDKVKGLNLFTMQGINEFRRIEVQYMPKYIALKIEHSYKTTIIDKFKDSPGKLKIQECACGSKIAIPL
jgi:hypothetical protein